MRTTMFNTTLYALVFALAVLPVSVSCGEGAVPTEVETQQLSAGGKRELLSILASGRLEILNSPQFGEYRDQTGEFYSSGGYVMNWVRRSRPTAQARIVIKRLEAAENEGLLAQDYDSSLWDDRLVKLDLPGAPANESELLRFDLALTICAMRYILDLHLGRINPQPFHAAFDFEPDIQGPSDFLRKRVMTAKDVEASFSALEPAFPSYRRLVQAVQRYKELAARDDGEQLPVPKYPVRPGTRYTGAPRLVRLLRLVGDLPPGTAPVTGVYTGTLAKAVKRFQRRHGLVADGALGERTLRQLNVPLSMRLRQLRLSLERWRWLPHRFARPPILVNIPEFRLFAGELRSQKVVVGMAFEHQTPVFASSLSEIIFRPPWTVPLSIQQKELVKDIGKDSGYLKKHDFEIIDGSDMVVSSGPVSASALARLRDGSLFLRQRPGPRNSLGLIKFLMPNSHSVYLHGTPSKRGFWESQRDLSHGCIRVEDPEALAVWALRDQPDWTPARIRAAMNGDKTVIVRITQPIPVLIQYGTAVAGEDGLIRFFEDIYGRDEAEGAAFEKRVQVARR